MRQHVLVLTLSGFILAGGSASATAQQGAGSPMMQQPTQQQTPQQDTGHDSMAGQRGMAGRGMMGHGNMMSMMGQRGMGGGMQGPMGMMGRPFIMRIMFILMDSNGDGAISLQEFQAAHERIFKAMDSNKDGGLSLDEMQAFMQGSKDSRPQQ
jgi:hypothetical protein